MKYNYYYQVVRSYGKYDAEYTIHQARKDSQKNIEIHAIPTILNGNHPSEIRDTIQHILDDMKKYPVVDKEDCGIFHEDLIYEEE